MISRSSTLILLFLCIKSIYAQDLKYPGKKDSYFSMVYTSSYLNNFQGIKSGYYLTNFLGLNTELGFQKQVKKLNDFEIEDKVKGHYGKIGVEFYSNFFKPKSHFRIIYGFELGYSKNQSSRTYRFSGPLYGDKFETMTYNYNVNFRVFNMGVVYIKRGIRFTSKVTIGLNKTDFVNNPYKVNAIAGSPFGGGFEFSLGYQIIKKKSKPFKSFSGSLFKLIF